MTDPRRAAAFLRGFADQQTRISELLARTDIHAGIAALDAYDLEQASAEHDAPRAGRQPREHPVPCGLCGIDARNKPRAMTLNPSGLCDLHDHEVRG